jgi:hypothetical protein
MVRVQRIVPPVPGEGSERELAVSGGVGFLPLPNGSHREANRLIFGKWTFFRLKLNNRLRFGFWQRLDSRLNYLPAFPSGSFNVCTGFSRDIADSSGIQCWMPRWRSVRARRIRPDVRNYEKE